MIFTVVDIETTGGSHGNRITEIAAVRTDGKEILAQFETLVNPSVFIPKSISLLTGISNDMVSDAPSFEEIADELDEFLGDTIFIAHNVSFDYGIIKNHFEDLGMNFNRKKLCTVRLSRGIIPGHNSYSLGKLCNDLGIKNKNRHRAMGDTMATVELFHLLKNKDDNDFILHSLNQLNREATLPPNLAKQEFDELPTSPGVYYLLGRKMEVLYVGKAKNIKKRIVTHFTESSIKKAELLRKIHHVSYEKTGNELVALLFESNEIKKNFPPYNKAQKYKRNNFHVCYYEGQDGVLRVDVFMQKHVQNSIKSFSSMVMAKDYLYQLVEKHNLCPKYAGLERTKSSCYRGSKCDFCSNRQLSSDYNTRVVEVAKTENTRLNIFIVGPGRTREEKAIVAIKNGEYQGFGYIDEDFQLDQEDLNNCITPYKNNQDIKRILNAFLTPPIAKIYRILEQQVTA